ncbi:unnamed protein product [Discula destructiva]
MTTPTPTDSATWTRGGGPLTTVFTTPDFCQTLYWQNTITPPLSSSICMPPRFKQVYDYSWGFYSPGICPTDWSAGCSFPTALATTGPNLGWISYGGPVLSTETVRICCPEGYVCVTEGVQQAYSKCSASTNTDELAYAIQVRWQESDLSILQTDPTVPGKTYEATATTGSKATDVVTITEGAGASNTAAAAATSSSGSEEAATGGTDSNGGDTQVTKSPAVWIGAGVAAAFIISAIAFFLWYRRKKRKSMARIDSTADNDGGTFSGEPNAGVMEMDAKAIARTTQYTGSSTAVSSELDSVPAVAEMPTTTMPPPFYAELQGSVAELPGDMPEQYHEKQIGNDDRRSIVSADEGSQHDSDQLGDLRRRSLGRLAPNYPSVSPIVPSPSSWTSAHVSELSERDRYGDTL